MQKVWITKLKDDGEDSIPVNDFSGIDESNAEDMLQTPYESLGLSIADHVRTGDIEHIQMTEVPKAYFTTIKERNGFDFKYYNNLLQITVRSNGTIYDLDSDPFEEVDIIENIDQFQDTDSMVNTGFIMSTSKDDYWENEKFINRIQFF